MQAGPEEHQGALIVVGSISAATSGQGNKKERNETCGCTVGIACHLRFFLAISKRQKCREHYLPQSIAQSLFLPRDLYRCHRLGMATQPSPALCSCRTPLPIVAAAQSATAGLLQSPFAPAPLQHAFRQG